MNPGWFAAILPIALAAAPTPSAAADPSAAWAPRVPQWGVQEIVVSSPRDYANPYTDVTVQAQVDCSGVKQTVSGFFDGDGKWKIRHMAGTLGPCRFRTRSNDKALNDVSGRYEVVAVSGEAHGPVRVANTYHFSYADGKPYFPLGTTSYAWLFRDAALQDRTVHAVTSTGFTKLRFALFPKWYEYNRVEPTAFPYLKKPDGTFDFDRFNPRFFDNVERRIGELGDNGVEADIILFHPYDHWGFATMTRAQDLAWVRYVVARLGAYHNVWWTMANEYDLMTPHDWDAIGQAVHDADPYGHLSGIHNAGPWYDHARPWIDHVIIQEGNPTSGRTVALARARYAKPVLLDEFGYEGDNGLLWGDLAAPEEVARFWSLTMAGGYGSHGETYMQPGGVLFWAAGGDLVGDSPSRLAFLKSVMTSLPFQQMVPSPELVDHGEALALPGKAYLFRFTPSPQFRIIRNASVRLAGADLFKVEAIDPWLMKIYPLGYTSAGDQTFTPPISSGLLRITAARPGDGVAQPLNLLTDKFAGNPGGHALFEAFFSSGMAGEKASTAKFVSVTPHFSADYAISLMLGNPEAKAVLEQYLPAFAIARFSFFTPAQLVTFKLLPAEKLEALDSALKTIVAR